MLRISKRMRIGLGPGHEQEVLDELAHVLDLLDDALERLLAILDRAGMAAQGDFGFAAEHGKGVRSSWLTSARNRTRSRSSSLSRRLASSSCCVRSADLRSSEACCRSTSPRWPSSSRPCD